MEPKPTAQQLLSQLKETQETTEAFKQLWCDYFPTDLPLPQDFEIRSAVRRLSLADLMAGMESYVVVISKGDAKPTSQKAMKYVCGAAWKIREQDNPDQEFHPTARRIRNAKRDADSPEWDGAAFHSTSPAERQKIMAETIAKQKGEAQ